MGYRECVETLVEDALRVFEEEDLLSLSTMPPEILLDDASRILENMMVFRRKCYRELSRDEYTRLWSVFNGALLKLAAALRENGAGDEASRKIVSMFTDDEVEALRELERYGKLDPEITPPERLAEIIVARQGEIYELVAEAVRRQYIDFAGLIKTWSREKRIRSHVSAALQLRYEKRFKNIVEAVKRLLDQQPAWLLRLFSEYEDALIEARRLRESVEEEVLARHVAEEAERLAVEARRSPDTVLERIGEAARRLEEAEKRIEEKIMDLVERSRSEASEAGREALEAEAERLRSLREKIGETRTVYEDAAVAASLEKSLGPGRGYWKGRPIGYDEARLLAIVFRERFAAHMEKLPLELMLPGGRRVVVNGWSDVFEKKTGSWTSLSYLSRRGVLRKKTVLVVEALYYARMDEMEKKGVDDTALGPGELADILEPRIMEARTGGYYHVLLVASPTGFAEKTRQYVSGEEYHRLVLSTSLALILIDPFTGETLHHPADEAAKSLAELLSPLLSFEKIEAAAEAIMSLEIDAVARSPSMPYYTLRELVEKTGYTAETIRAAMEKLEKQGRGRVKAIDDRIVFVYGEEG